MSAVQRVTEVPPPAREALLVSCECCGSPTDSPAGWCSKCESEQVAFDAAHSPPAPLQTRS